MSNPKKGAKTAKQSEAWKPRNNHDVIFGENFSEKTTLAWELSHFKREPLSKVQTFIASEVYNSDFKLNQELKEMKDTSLILDGCHSPFNISKFVCEMEAINKEITIVFVFRVALPSTFQKQFPFFKYHYLGKEQPADTWQDFLNDQIGDHFTNLELVQSIQQMHHKAIIQLNADGCETQHLDDMNAVARIVTAIMFENERRQQAAATA
jgi:hypothetical protein